MGLGQSNFKWMALKNDRKQREFKHSTSAAAMQRILNFLFGDAKCSQSPFPGSGADQLSMALRQTRSSDFGQD